MYNRCQSWRTLDWRQDLEAARCPGLLQPDAGPHPHHAVRLLAHTQRVARLGHHVVR